MRQTLLEWREKLQISIWLIPVQLCLGALGLAMVLLWAERELDPLAFSFRTFAMPVASAREVLGVIAASVLSVGGVVFSVTMVALTLTSGQYGPKILRQFLGDNASKISLGMFLGTSLYCLVMLAAYEETDQPSITVIAALLLTIAALAGFIRFIHSTATDLQADRIIQLIGGELRQFFVQFSTGDGLGERCNDTLGWRRRARGHRPVLVAAEAEGYVQTVDYPALVKWCVDRDCVVLLRFRAGDFALKGNCLAKVFGAESRLHEDDATLLRSGVRTGDIRTPVQDPEYPITQLNQLTARALSPGINDPGTAITAIDWFTLAVAQIVDRDLPGKVFLDAAGTPRLLVRFTDFPGIVKAFYAPSRQFALGNIPVIIALLESLIRLAELTARRDRLEIIARHGRELSNSLERGSHMDYDLDGFKQRYARLEKLTRRFAQTAAECG